MIIYLIPREVSLFLWLLINKYSKLKIQKEINNGLSSTLFLALNELNQKLVIKLFNRSSKEAYLREKEFFKNNHNFKNIIRVYNYGLIKNRKENNRYKFIR